MDPPHRVQPLGYTNGYTDKSWYGPNERFLRHLVGKDHSKSVWKWGTRLLDELYGELPALKDREAAEDQERELAARLHAAGYSVHGGS